jgi:predicted dehydrogenase
MTAVGLGIIGYGIMGERLLRAAVAHDPEVLRLTGVYDPDETALARLAGEFPDIPRYRSSEALIKVADCVHVASPPSSHLEHADRVLGLGRAVFLEKPLSIDMSEGREFARMVDGGKERAAVNFPFASSFAVDQLRAWRDEGAVGKPERIEIEVAFRAWPRQWQVDAAGWLARREEGGFTREVVSHFLFLTVRQAGPLRLQDATVEWPDDDGCEHAIEARLEAGGVPVALHGRVGGTDQDDHNLWTLHGTDGAIRLRDWSIAERQDATGRWQAAENALPNEKVRPLVLKRQLDKVSAMARGKPHGLATVGEAFAVQEIVEAILKS